MRGLFFTQLKKVEYQLNSKISVCGIEKLVAQPDNVTYAFAQIDTSLHKKYLCTLRFIATPPHFGGTIGSVTKFENFSPKCK
jgi:hypothetical protein